MTEPEAATTFVTWLQETNIQAAIIAPIITTIISMITYAYRQGQKRQVSLAKLIQDIEWLAIEHWCCPGSDANNKIRGVRISNELQTLSWRINKKNAEERKALIAYRKAITGGDFSDPSRQDVVFNNPRIILIKKSAQELRRILKIKRDH